MDVDGWMGLDTGAADVGAQRRDGGRVDSGQRTADSGQRPVKRASRCRRVASKLSGTGTLSWARSPPALQGYYSGLEHPGPEQPPVVPAGPLYSQAAMTCRPVIASTAVDDEPTWVGDTLRSRRWAIGDQAALGELPCFLCAFHYLPT